MDIRFHEKLYRDEISDHKLSVLQKRIKKRKPKLNLFLVTLPLGSQGLLEVYWYPELLQSYYRNLDVSLTVVGIAKSREQAFEMVSQIVNDAGICEGNVPINEFFKENT